MRRSDYTKIIIEQGVILIIDFPEHRVVRMCVILAVRWTMKGFDMAVGKQCIR